MTVQRQNGAECNIKNFSVLQTKQSLEEELERKKQTIVEELKSINPHKINFLRETGELDKVMMAFPTATIDIQETDVVITGLLTEVNGIKVAI